MSTGSTSLALAVTYDDPDLRRDDGSLLDRAFFGFERHELIAEAAEALLTTSARAEVTRVFDLIGGATLADVSTWADRIKDRDEVRPDDDAETVAFIEGDGNLPNGRWHYVNLPVGAESYDPDRYPDFVRITDVVQMTQACVRVLQGTSDRFSEVNALRLLVHLVGDLHQPLHIGCGYLETVAGSTVLVRDPDAAHGLPHDEGGNRLFVPANGGHVKLHRYWDSQLGEDPVVPDSFAGAEPAAADADRKRRLVPKLLAMIGPEAPAAAAATLAADPLETWPVTWAGETLIGARSAYETLEIAGPRGGDDFDLDWEGQAAYDARCGPIVTERLAAAGQNLAALLNALWP